jgi:phage terminase large subunit-like protein
MFTSRGLVKAEDLVVGDRLEMGSVPRSFGILQTIIRLPWAPVYCVTVDEKHELIANGFRVGNSFDQGRKKFQGTAKNLVFLDEEPPLDVYTECLARLMTKDGIMICTFTPLNGISDVVLMYLPELAPDVSDIRSEDETEY